ncbi:caspase family protein [Oscillatoria sp. FACHB-1407]|uniref:caspase family protein n=1 Tax=Oscillatoria sp. FACHB-1407 TaxID=2692847 RepID=UPI0016867E0A|nr:caspase family protein [Oscillatoria sp. FACHB-1407]MBD2461536.1 caspase family protein [Oscillatoria sp. FACHB-1407]
MRQTRRAFLQQLGMTLGALSFSDLSLSVLTRYQQALAQPTQRKLALLVGINQYPEQVCDYVPVRGNALNGCLTDVELQRELLIHRFGFQPSDILTLTDQQATRQAIEEAFVSHLIEQAHAGDVVVFHFSGLGSRVKVDATTDAIQNSLVPIDGVLPTEENPAIHDLLLDTLNLLVRSLPTDQVTTVLDLSYADLNKVTQNNLRIRSRPSTPTGQLNDRELAFQEQLLSRLKLSRNALANPRLEYPGITLTAARSQQGAIEAQWSGFSAGLFTYALTQQLWQSTPTTTVRVTFNQVVHLMNQSAGDEQQPQLSGAKGQGSDTAYHLATLTPAADGVVTAIEDDGKTLQLWMGGLQSSVLDYYGSNTVLALEPQDESVAVTVSDRPQDSTPLSSDSELSASPASTSHLLQVRSREGLIVRARLLNPTAPITPTVGQFVRETVRLLPRNISLGIALDSTLERIERVDATSAFAAVPKVSTVVGAEQPADYVFGRAMPDAQTVATDLSHSSDVHLAGVMPNSDVSPKGKYGLFNLGRAAIPNTLIQGDEAVKTAVNRLTPQLRSLLAMKLLRLIHNSDSSRLGVRATLEVIAPQEQIIAQQESSRAPWTLPQSKLAQRLTPDSSIPTIAIGSHVRYRLQNYGDRPVYFTLLGTDTRSGAIALYPLSPTEIDQPDLQNKIAPGETVLLPPPAPAPAWVINGPAGLTETHLVFSRAPLTQCTAMLDTAVGSNNTVYRVGALANPLEVVHALLQDLHQASVAVRSTSPSGAIAPVIDPPSDAYLLSVDVWAGLSFAYRVT